MRFASVGAVIATLFSGAFAACSSSDLKGPEGNAIHAPLTAETVQMGSTYTVTWTPSTSGPLDLHLLYGPTSADMTSILVIATGITNNGSYTWTVPSQSSGMISTLTSGYGIQLIDTSSCTYQYSDNFGIENPNAVTQTLTLVSASSTSTETTTVANVTSFYTGATGTAAAGGVTGTGTAANFTSPILSPTKSMTVPASLKTTTTAVITSAAGGSATTQAATASSSGAAVPTGVVRWERGVLIVAGVVGALVL